MSVLPENNEIIIEIDLSLKDDETNEKLVKYR